MRKEFEIKDMIPVIKTVIESGQTVKITVTGNSMYPLLVGGRDRAELSSPVKLNKRDVILYRRKTGKYVFHRILKINHSNGELILCGDNETEKEYGVNVSGVIARAVAFERKGKEFKSGNVLYKIYSFLWCISLRMRKPMLKLMRMVYFFVKIKKNS